MNQIAVIGVDATPHDCWEDAVQHIATATATPRETMWIFHGLPDGALVFNERLGTARSPVAWIASPQQYQAAKSRGDLEDLGDAPSLFFRRAGGLILRPGSTPSTHTMPQVESTPKQTSRQHGKRMKLSPRAKKAAADESPAALMPAKPEQPSLLPSSPAGVLTREAAARMQVRMVPLKDIRPDPTQPRKTFAPEALAELVESIKTHGVEQAILVRPRNPDGGPVRDGGRFGWYEIVYGERRWRASKEAGLTEIPAKVQVLTDIEAAEKQGIENLERAELLPLEVAAQYRKLLSLPGYTMQRLMEVTGHGKSTIHGKLKLLELPEPAKQAVASGQLGQVTAERIARLEGPVQEKALEAILQPQHGVGGVKRTVSDREAQVFIDMVKKDEEKRVRIREMMDGATARGMTWLEPRSKAYEKVFGYSYDPKPESGLTTLDAVIVGDAEYRTYNKVLATKPGKGAAKEIKPTAATVRNEKLLELYDTLKLRDALKAAGVVFSNRKISADPSEAIRRRRDKRMKDVLTTAAMVIGAKAQAMTPRMAQSAETEGMWRALALAAARAVRGDDLRAFVKRRDLPLVRYKPYNAGEEGSPDFTRTAEKFIATQPTSALAGITAELLLMQGAWWSQNLDFSSGFRKAAPAFGVDLRRLKIEAGASEEEVDEEEASNRKFNDEEDDSASARTEETAELEDAMI